MWDNYLKTGFRSLLRYKMFSIINIVGFAAGLATVLIIFLYLRHEKSFDQHLSKKDRLFRIVVRYSSLSEVGYTTPPYPLVKTLRNELPGNHQVVSVFRDLPRPVQVNGKTCMQEQIVFTDSVFCSLFDVKLTHGNPEDLNKPHSVFLTEQLADKYFGNQDARGREITLARNLQLTVRGIFKEPPHNTHLPFQFIVSENSLTKEYVSQPFDTWEYPLAFSRAYILLENKENRHELAKKINSFNRFKRKGWQQETILEPVDEIHLNDYFSLLPHSYTTNRNTIWIFLSVSLLVLSIAVINFINLSLVQAIGRIREIGMRRTLGADIKNVFSQFLAETAIIAVLATILAIILVEVFLPYINRILDLSMHLTLYADWVNILFLLGIMVILSLLAGFFPSFFVLKHRPIESLRKNYHAPARNTSIAAFRKLVFAQFMITQMLLVSILVMQQQVKYLRSKDLGFSTDNVLILKVPRNDTTGRKAFRTDAMRHPNVSQVSLAFALPNQPFSNDVSMFTTPGDEVQHAAYLKVVDNHFYDVFSIKMKAGQWFQDHSIYPDNQHIIVNETLTRKLGYAVPDSAVGKLIAIDTRVLEFNNKYFKIAGVTNDFNVYSLHDELFPVIFIRGPNKRDQMSIKLEGPPDKPTLQFLRKSYKKHIPGHPFVHKMYEDEIRKQYWKEEQAYFLLGGFGLIAIILASMGLFGLVSFMMIRKTREIGIRKANGASVHQVVRMFVFRYLGIILFAGIFAGPVAYYLMDRWLSDYAYRVDLTLEYFFVGLLIMLGSGLLSVVFQTVKTAGRNPADTLRDE